MKKIIYLTTAAVLTAASLAGCSSVSSTDNTADNTAADTTTAAAASDAEGSDSAAADVSDVTLQDILDANNVADLVAKYGAVTLTTNGYFNDELGSTSTYYFYTDDQGQMQMLGSMITEDGSLSPYYIATTSTEDSAALFTLEDNGISTPNIQVMDRESLDQTIEMYYQCEYEAPQVDVSLQDDALVLTTHLDFEYNSGSSDTYYFCNPETLELYAINSVFTYQYEEDGKEVTSGSQANYTFSYGVNEEAAGMTNAIDAAQTTDDPCEFTVVTNPGSADETTQTFHLTKGIHLTCVGYDVIDDLYSDAACTQAINDTSTIDTDKDAVTVYAVKTSEEATAE